MKNVFYICSELPCIVRIDNDCIFSCGKDFYKHTLDGACDHFFTVQPLNLLDREYHFVIRHTQKGFEVNDMFGELCSWGSTTNTLNIADIKARHFSYSEVVCQLKKKCFDKNNTFIVVQDSFLQLIIDNTNFVMRHILPDELRDVVLKCDIIDNIAVFALSGKVKSKQFILVATSSKDCNWEIKVDSLAEKIEQNEGNTYILTDTLDLAGRAKVEIYDSLNFTKVEEYYVYTQGAPIRVKDINLLPVQFFQALKSGDSSDALSCLTADLKSGATFEDLLSFLGQYYKIVPNTFISGYENTFGLIDSGNNAILFRFEFSNNLIDNISEIEYTKP